jgi:dihydrofolate reductase
MRKVIVAAVGRNGVIGVAGGLPWRLPEDLARFKEITMGHALVMGRATYESIGRPLPGRSNIVLTRSPDWSGDGVDVVSSLQEAVDLAADRGQDVFFSGGAEVYRMALDISDRLELTEVDAEPDGDTFFPPVDWSKWREVSRQDRAGFAWVGYERV